MYGNGKWHLFTVYSERRSIESQTEVSVLLYFIIHMLSKKSFFYDNGVQEHAAVQEHEH